MTAGPAHTEHPTSTVNGAAPASGTRAPAERALLAALSVQDKVRLLTGAANWRTHGAPAIGLRPMIVSDGPSGVRGVTKDERHPSTCLPCPSATGATWDTELITELAAALGAEARGKGVDVLLAPTINLMRTPMGGRGFECFSEDPVLTARMAVAFITGLQSAGVAATVKHFVGNDSETERWTYDVVVSEQVLRELYLAPFETCVREAGTAAGDGRLQQGQRHSRHGASLAAEEDPQGRMGVRRRGGLGLERGQDHGGDRGRRAGPGDAGPGRALGGRPGAGGPGRGDPRVRDRRQGCPDHPAGAVGRRAGRAGRAGGGWSSRGEWRPGPGRQPGTRWRPCSR